MADELVLAGVYLAALLGGMAFGLIYFVILWRGTSSFVLSAADRGHGTGWLLIGFALRLALAAGALGLAIWAGAEAMHLLVAALGFTVMRHLAIRNRRRQG